MINIHFDKTSAWIAFIIGIVVGFFVRPYIMEIFNNELMSENQALKDRIAQLENKEITLTSCNKINYSNVACKFISNKDYEYLTIYAYGSVLKAQNNIIGYAEAVEASDVSVVKTEEGNVSSWKFSATSFVVNFQMSEQMVNASVELFVKFDQESASTFRFPSVNKKP